MLLLITWLSWLHPVQFKKDIVQNIENTLGPMILRQMPLSRGPYKHNYTASLKSMRHQRQWFLKACDHMRGFSKTSTERILVWAPSKNRVCPKANLKPVCSSSTVCALRTTLAEVLGLPPPSTKLSSKQWNSSFTTQESKTKVFRTRSINRQHMDTCHMQMIIY